MTSCVPPHPPAPLERGVPTVQTAQAPWPAKIARLPRETSARQGLNQLLACLAQLGFSVPVALQTGEDAQLPQEPTARKHLHQMKAYLAQLDFPAPVEIKTAYCVHLGRIQKTLGPRRAPVPNARLAVMARLVLPPLQGRHARLAPQALGLLNSVLAHGGKMSELRGQPPAFDSTEMVNLAPPTRSATVTAQIR
jgi:hypothetical protein